MSAVIAWFVFFLSLIYLLPWEELFPNKYFRNSLNTILSRQRATFSLSTSIVLRKISPVVNGAVVWFRIDGYSPRWKKHREMIRISGLDKDMSPEQFIAIKYLASASILMYFLLLIAYRYSPELVVLALGMVLIGFFLPDQWLKARIRKRKWDIQKELPSVLISLAVTTDAGLSLFQALEELCHTKKGALVEEMGKTIQEIAVGIPQKEAFENMANRVLVEELSIFVSSLLQTLDKGSSGLTQLLREQANSAWIKRKSKAKELGEKASIKLFFPLISLTLPALMIFLITPAIFSILKFFV